jgi:hypothetical protein
MRAIKIFFALAMIFPSFSASASASASATSKSKHYVVLIDDSASNPLVTDSLHAGRIATDMAREIVKFEMRDRITIAPFGRFGGNPILDVEVNKRLNPDKAMQSVKGMVGGFPEAVRTVLGGPAPVTHIQGALQLAASRVNCSEVQTIVFVLSDGRETGDDLRIQPIFQGCEAFIMIGVIGDTPAETATIGEEWKQWCGGAGFHRCKVIN